MSKNKSAASESQAAAEIEPEPEAEAPKPPSEVLEAPKESAPPEREIMEWAVAKGHVFWLQNKQVKDWAASKGYTPPKIVMRGRGDGPKGPDANVICAHAFGRHGQLAGNRVTEEAYDKLVTEAYSIAVGET